MSRRPQDPFDPFDFDDRNNSPFGGFDPFNDPFFKQFEEIHNHMFREFFGEHDRPSIFIEHPHSQTPNHNNNTPDLSQINPNAPPSNNNNNNQNNNYSNRTTAPSFFKMFEHFFEPEYDDHKLSDINPSLSHGPIMDNDNDNKGLIHTDDTPPGFRSPYLPNSTGAEKDMEFNKPQTFYRSQSVVISTGPDGKTTKTTTIRDGNGEIITNTEEFDANDNGYNNDIRNIFNFGFGNRNENNYENDKPIRDIYPNDGHKRKYKLFEQTHDPFEKFREKWQNWKWNPYNWNKGYDNGNHNENYNVFRDRYNSNNNNGNRNDGIRWRSYQDYKHGNKGPSLLDDIVKKDDK